MAENFHVTNRSEMSKWQFFLGDWLASLIESPAYVKNADEILKYNSDNMNC